MRDAATVLHDSLQEWNTDEFVELGWNTKAANRAIEDLRRAGFEIVPISPVTPANPPALDKTRGGA